MTDNTESLISLARAADGPAGYAAFYYLLFGRSLPRHAAEEWLPAITQARAAGQGVVIEAFRGSGKTTAITLGWLAYRIGQAPQHSNLLLAASEESAQLAAQAIAELIAHNPGWALAFPEILPDRKAGWSRLGYNVLRRDMEYESWRQLTAQTRGKDPTLLGLGYRSRAVIGKHPSGVLLVDDIHDEHNSRPGREFDLLRKIMRGTVLPTLNPETLQVFVGTPWTENDVLAQLRSSGRYISVRTPVQRGGEPVWPERFPQAEIEKQRDLAGSLEFARMYLLDLKAARGRHLKPDWLHEYPLEKIDPRWPVVLGVDYASTADKLAGRERDHFAVAIGRVLPGGAGIVLVDGIREQASQSEAEAHIVRLAQRYPSLQTIGVEAVGKGEEFYNLLARRYGLPLTPQHTGRQSKGMRFERGMAPLFESRRAWLADVGSPFLNAFREEWAQWPDGAHDDTLDAVYWMLYTGSPHLMAPLHRVVKQENPFLDLARV